MTRFADQHLPDVFERVSVVVLQIIQRGAPVPGFDIVGPELDDGIERGNVDVTTEATAGVGCAPA